MSFSATRSPLQRRVKGVFIPVRDVHRARAWYRDVLELSVGEVLFGHLCCIQLEGQLDLLLDQKLTPAQSGSMVVHGGYPLFMFATEDIPAALQFLQVKGVEVVEYNGQIIQNAQWFNFKDCDGNLLMACGPSR